MAYAKEIIVRYLCCSDSANAILKGTFSPGWCGSVASQDTCPGLIPGAGVRGCGGAGVRGQLIDVSLSLPSKIKTF